MDLYAATHDGSRPLHCFQERAPAEVQAALGATLADYSLVSARTAVVRCLDLLETSLDPFTGGSAILTEGQRELLRRVRERSNAPDDSVD